MEVFGWKASKFQFYMTTTSKAWLDAYLSILKVCVKTRMLKTSARQSSLLNMLKACHCLLVQNKANFLPLLQSVRFSGQDMCENLNKNCMQKFPQHKEVAELCYFPKCQPIFDGLDLSRSAVQKMNISPCLFVAYNVGGHPTLVKYAVGVHAKSDHRQESHQGKKMRKYVSLGSQKHVKHEFCSSAKPKGIGPIHIIPPLS